MRDWLLISVVFICALNAVRNPVFGMLAFVFFSLFGAHSMTWDLGRSFPFAQVIAAGVLIGVLAKPKLWRIPLQRESILMYLLWVLFAVTTQFATYPERASAQLGHVSKILLMVVLSTMLITNKKDLDRFVLVIALAIGFHGLKGGFWFCLTGGREMVLGPEATFLEANNAIGIALAMNIPLLWYLKHVVTSLLLRMTLLAMFVFSYPAVIGTFSRGAWLAAGMATLVMLWRSRHRFATVLACLMVTALSLPLVTFLPQRVKDRYDSLLGYQEDSSAQSRLSSWRFATNVALANPVVGAGFDYYSIESYQRYYPEFLSLFPGKVWSCHSIWLTMVSEHGFPGLILWILLIASCFLSVRKLRAQGKADPDRAWLVAYANMLAASLSAYVVAGSFVDAAYYDTFYHDVAVIVILKNWIVMDEDTTPEPAEVGSDQWDEMALATVDSRG